MRAGDLGRVPVSDRNGRQNLSADDERIDMS